MSTHPWKCVTGVNCCYWIMPLGVWDAVSPPVDPRAEPWRGSRGSSLKTPVILHFIVPKIRPKTAKLLFDCFCNAKTTVSTKLYTEASKDYAHQCALFYF